MSTLRVGILGCGGIGARHAAAVTALGNRMTLVAACGRTLERAESFAAEHGGQAYADVDRMLGEAALDLLVVALPPFAHEGQVEAAAGAGVHLLVEKPIALDLDRARSMVAAADTAGIVAACGFMYRFGAAVERWTDLAAQGATGRPGQFSGHFHCNALHAPWWRSRAHAGGQMVEQLIHIIDLARVMVGEPQSVYARAANLFHRDVPDYDIEDVSAIVLGYDDGRIATLNANNIAAPGQWSKGWRMAAETAYGVFTDFNAAEIHRRNADVERISSQRDVFVAQMADVADAIAEHRSPRVPLVEGLQSLALALAARQSADEGREIVVSPER